ncbi:tetratricopeptide repeat protein [Streptomyces violaceusniger]|uniref:Helix-turn-helix domain protein n=1 Tax=Streptomyces violaceusniger (strain Tu 4113) TaxID=653045 RepID=G2PH12_STRV4|nr:tetratricopeptide repeat protein [Streptomyces violaceusniger]AEM88586.1 helix-turn-helix domain protein [Streptomyces violaceusniger Tu 4113]
MPGQFNAALRHLRSQRGLSLRQFARIVHYSPGWLSRIERGQAAPTLALARSCDDALSARGKLLELARLEARVRLLPAQLPSADAGFVGRADALRGLDDALAKAERAGTALTVAIDGPPGVGKSALTIQWAHRVASRFPGGVLFTDLQGHSHQGRPADPMQVLEGFLAALGTESVPDELEARSALFRTVMADRHVLVVLDNAVDSQQVKPLLMGAPSCAVIVTSRRRLTGLGVTAGARRLSLAPMENQESLELLRGVVGGKRVDDEYDAARAVALRCAHLPLALRITAERLATHLHWPISHVADELSSEDRLDVLADRDDDDLTVRKVFDLSYQALDEDTARMFRLLGLYPGARISAAAAAALAGYPLARTRVLLDELVAVHLVEETGLDRYWTHDLLRNYAADRAAVEESQTERVAAAHRLTSWYTLSVDAANIALAPQREVPLLEPPPAGVIPLTFTSDTAAEEARAWLDEEVRDSAVPMVRLAARYRLPEAWHIPVRLWNWLLLRKPWSMWISSHTIGLEAAATYGRPGDQAWVEMNLGEAYRQSGDYDRAEQHVTQALTLRRRNGDRQGQAWCLEALGFIAADRKETPLAHAYFSQALNAFRQTGDLHGEAVARCSLAEADGLLGNAAASEAGFKEGLELHRRMGDLFGEGMFWERRAHLHQQHGALVQAVQCLDRSAECHYQGSNDWGQAAAHDLRAQLLEELSRWEEARKACERAWRLFDQLGDPRAARLRDRLAAWPQAGTLSVTD